MGKKLIATISLVLTFALAAVTFLAVPAGATPSSPGACNMLHTDSNGYKGMGKASEQGMGNMMALVIESETSGCSL